MAIQEAMSPPVEVQRYNDCKALKEYYCFRRTNTAVSTCLTTSFIQMFTLSHKLCKIMSGMVSYFSKLRTSSIIFVRQPMLLGSFN